jgi:eukaryotic-like serine/threonine-protein kinase
VWIGQYRLTSRLATGGMAEVYVGRHITEAGQFGPMVAVKRLLPHLVKDPGVVRMFLNEARITSQVQHPNVVKVFELGQAHGEPFIAMELLEGHTFAELRMRAAEDGRRVPLAVALRILIEACRGLDAAHRAVDEQGRALALVHRDFTPDNIHVGITGDVKVIDFGVARTSSWGSGTEPGTLKGKYFYMSPEMILGQPVDLRADLFAAGVMLYEQLCGRRPFTGNTIDEVVRAIAKGKPALPSTFDPSVPQSLEAVCLTALNKSPDARFASLGAFVEALEAIASGEATHIATPSQVSAQLGLLFPPQEDRKRETLRRAREADPSVPGLTPSGGAVAAAPAPIVLPEPELVRPEASELDELVLPPPVLAPPPQVVKPTLVAPPPRGQRFAAFGVVALMLALAGVGVWFFGGNTKTSAEWLQDASLAKGPAVSAALLALAKAEDATDAQLRQASALAVSSQSWEAGLSLSEAWLKRTPTSGEAKLLEGQCAARLKKAKRAEAALREADTMLKNDARPATALAQLKEAMGDANGALEAWQRAEARDRKATHAAVRVGFWQSQLGRLDEATATLEPILKHGVNAEAAAELGFVKFRQSKPDEASVWLDKAVAADSKLASAHYYRAAVQYQRGEVGKARESYLKADALAPGDVRALVAMCEMEAQQGLPNEETKQKMKSRFAAEAPQLVSACDRVQPQR